MVCTDHQAALFQKACDEAGDEQMALLELRNTPVTGIDKSLAQLLISCKSPHDRQNVRARSTYLRTPK